MPSTRSTLIRSPWKACIGVTLCLALCACATEDPKQVADIVATPLNDLNLVKAEIPAVLVEAGRQPYGLPAAIDCEALDAAVRDLDAALGPDLDAPASDDNPSLIERGTQEAKQAALGTVRRSAEGVVPFRGWIRKLSGAERYSRRVAAAITAGTVRRSFLKGVRAGRDCL